MGSQRFVYFESFLTQSLTTSLQNLLDTKSLIWVSNNLSNHASAANMVTCLQPLCLQTLQKTCYFFQNQLSEQNLKSYMTQILVRWIFLRPSFSLAAETKKGHRFVDLSHQLKKFFPMHLGCKNSKQLRTDSSFKRVSFVDSLKHSKCSDSHGKIKSSYWT